MSSGTPAIVEVTEVRNGVLRTSIATLSPEAEEVIRIIAKENDDTTARAIARALDTSARFIDREPETPKTAGDGLGKPADGMTPVLRNLEREALLTLEGIVRVAMKSDAAHVLPGDREWSTYQAIRETLDALDATRETAAREAGRGTFASGRKL